VASLLIRGEASIWKQTTGRAEVTEKATFGGISVVGDGMSGRQSGVSEETCLACERKAGVRARIVCAGQRMNQEG